MLRLPVSLLAMVLCASATIGGEARVEVGVIVPPLQRLEVSPGVSRLPVVSPLDLSAGFMEPGAPVLLTVYSNSPWELSIRRAAASADDEYPDTAPILWKPTDGEYFRISEAWAIVAVGSSAVEGQAVRIHLRFLLDWRTARPGAYEPRIEYRLTPVGG